MAFLVMHRQWRSQEFLAGYAKYKKKIKANTQYNGP
jgi:hypothetical protein